MTRDAAGLRADVTVTGRVAAHADARPGEVVAVVGPNGSGKSTLLQALAGLVPMTGRVEVGGEDWTGLPVPARRLGYVFQDHSLFPHLDALANVAFGPRARGVRRRDAEVRARDWLDRLGVGGLAARRPGELSGGQAQRVALARALATEPALLLLDEPFASLDVGVAAGLRMLLGDLLPGLSCVTLLVTHDAVDALTLADRVLVLESGRVVQSGAPHDVAARPHSDHVARLVGLNLVREAGTTWAFSPTDVTVSPDPPHGSARLRWHGRIVAVTPHGEAWRLAVDTDPPLLADVTPSSGHELGLAPGRAVWLSVKETAARRYEVTDR